MPDQPTAESRLRLLAEQATLWSAVSTVALYTIGRISHFYFLAALGVPRLRIIDIPWQDYVFEGGLAVLNTTLKAIAFEAGVSPAWVAALALTVLFFWLRGRAAKPWRRGVLLALACAGSLATLLLVAIPWGRYTAKLFRESPRSSDHFVFTPDALPSLPPALLQDNDKRALRVITTTPDFFVLLSGDGKTSYELPIRSVALHDLQPTANRP